MIDLINVLMKRSNVSIIVNRDKVDVYTPKEVYTKRGDSLDILRSMITSGELNGLYFAIFDSHKNYHLARTEIDTIYTILEHSGFILVYDCSNINEVNRAVHDSIKHYNMKYLWFFDDGGYCLMQKGW